MKFIRSWGRSKEEGWVLDPVFLAGVGGELEPGEGEADDMMLTVESVLLALESYYDTHPDIFDDYPSETNGDFPN